MRALVTGSTGFIGKKVVRDLATHAEKIYIIVRPKSIARAKDAFDDIPNVQIVPGDLTDDDILQDIGDYLRITHEVDTIINLAGHYDLTASAYETYNANVIGVQNMIHLASKCHNLEFFHHISTYAVSGNLQGVIAEDDMDNLRNLSDNYAISKMNGEKIFRNADLPNVKKRIYRPGIVVGSIENGEIEKIDGPYYLMKFIHENQEYFRKLAPMKVLPLPYAKNATLPLVPVDVLSEWMTECFLNPDQTEELRSYHMLGEQKLLLSDFVEKLLKSYDIPLKLVRLKRVKQLKHLLPALGMPKELLEYMFHEVSFNMDNRKEDYPQLKDFNINQTVNTLIKNTPQILERI